MPNLPFQPLLKVRNSAALFLLILASSGLTVQAQTADDLSIIRRSSFDSPAASRDPLLPIGWKKEAPVVLADNGTPVVRTAESYILPSAFIVSSISLDRIPLAVINGKAYGEGDLMAFNAGGEKIQLQIAAIKDGAVVLSYKAHKVVCPIRASQIKKPLAQGDLPK